MARQCAQRFRQPRVEGLATRRLTFSPTPQTHMPLRFSTIVTRAPRGITERLDDFEDDGVAQRRVGNIELARTHHAFGEITCSSGSIMPASS